LEKPRRLSFLAVRLKKGAGLRIQISHPVAWLASLGEGEPAGTPAGIALTLPGEYNEM